MTEQREDRDEQMAISGLEPTTASHRQEQFLQIVRFGISGLTSTLFYAVVALLLVTLFAMQPVLASVLSYLLSLGVSYGLQSRFTFRQKDDHPFQVVRFVVTALLGLAASFALVFAATEILHWWFVIGNLAVCVFVPVANYFVLKIWVFAPAGRGLTRELGVTGNE